MHVTEEVARLVRSCKPELEAAAEWLEQLTESWHDLDSLSLTSVQEKTLHRLRLSGLIEVESRHCVMTDGGQTTVRFQAVWSGWDNPGALLARDVFPLYASFREGAPYRHESIPLRARLSSAGVSHKRAAAACEQAFANCGSSDPGPELDWATRPLVRLAEIVGLPLTVVSQTFPRRYAQTVPGTLKHCSAPIDQTQPATPALETAATGAVDSGRTTRKPTADELMKAELATNLDEVQGLTAKAWGDRIGRSKAAVVATPTWKSLQLLRADARAEKQLDRHRNGRGQVGGQG